MSCAQVRPLLPARRSELSFEQARAVAEHTATCRRCAAEVRAYRSLREALAALATVELEPSEGLVERLLGTLDRPQAAGSRTAVLAASSAGALVLTVLVARHLRQRRRGAPAPAPARRLPRVAGQALPARALPARAR